MGKKTMVITVELKLEDLKGEYNADNIKSAIEDAGMGRPELGQYLWTIGCWTDSEVVGVKLIDETDTRCY